MSVNQYLDFNLNNFNKVNEVSNFVEINSNENDLIFVDDSITPLIALLSKRNIVDGFADSNNLRFRSGITSTEETISKLNNLKFFIVYKIKFGQVTGTYGPAYLDEFSNFIKEECSLAQSFSEQAQQYTKVYEVYDCS